MPTVKQEISHVKSIDREFVGTVAFKNEKLCLPDGSKVAIGMDGPQWVIVYQEAPSKPFVVWEYNAEKNTVIIDKKVGGADDMARVKNILSSFFKHAEIDDLVTIEAGGRSL
jgi:hypothetical protein